MLSRAQIFCGHSIFIKAFLIIDVNFWEIFHSGRKTKITAMLYTGQLSGKRFFLYGEPQFWYRVAGWIFYWSPDECLLSYIIPLKIYCRFIRLPESDGNCS